MKHGRLAHVRSQFSLFRRSPTHKNLPPATFCTSERVFAVLFARRKKYQSVSLTGKLRGSANLDSAHPNKNFPLTKLKPFSKKDSRFCKPRISAQNYNFAQTQLNPFAALGGIFLLLPQHFFAVLRPIRRITAVSLPGQHTPCAFPPQAAEMYNLVCFWSEFALFICLKT